MAHRVGFYATETEIFYSSPSGRAWLVASAEGPARVREVDEIPREADWAASLVSPEEAAEWIGRVRDASGEGAGQA